MNPKGQSRIRTYFTVLAIFGIFAIVGYFLGPHIAVAQSGSYSAAEESIYPVRLDLKLIDMKTKIVGSAIIKDIPENTANISSKYTVVESTFTARAQAFGGDIYLPSYREDVVAQAVVTVPLEGSNAIVPGVSTIEIIGDLPRVKGKFLLKEYEQATIRIRVSYKILPRAMPSRLVFATKLNTVLSYPAAYENGLNDPGLNPNTGERLINIPLINATYIPQQVTRVDWKTEPVVLIKNTEKISSLKNIFKDNNQASVPASIKSFLQLFK